MESSDKRAYSSRAAAGGHQSNNVSIRNSDGARRLMTHEQVQEYVRFSMQRAKRQPKLSPQVMAELHEIISYDAAEEQQQGGIRKVLSEQSENEQSLVAKSTVSEILSDWDKPVEASAGSQASYVVKTETGGKTMLSRTEIHNLVRSSMAKAKRQQANKSQAPTTTTPVASSPSNGSMLVREQQPSSVKLRSERELHHRRFTWDLEPKDSLESLSGESTQISDPANNERTEAAPVTAAAVIAKKTTNRQVQPEQSSSRTSLQRKLDVATLAKNKRLARHPSPADPSLHGQDAPTTMTTADAASRSASMPHPRQQQLKDNMSPKSYEESESLFLAYRAMSVANLRNDDFKGSTPHAKPDSSDKATDRREPRSATPVPSINSPSVTLATQISQHKDYPSSDACHSPAKLRSRLSQVPRLSLQRLRAQQASAKSATTVPPIPTEISRPVKHPKGGKPPAPLSVNVPPALSPTVYHSVGAPSPVALQSRLRTSTMPTSTTSTAAPTPKSSWRTKYATSPQQQLPPVTSPVAGAAQLEMVMLTALELTPKDDNKREVQTRPRDASLESIATIPPYSPTGVGLTESHQPVPLNQGAAAIQSEAIHIQPLHSPVSHTGPSATESLCSEDQEEEEDDSEDEEATSENESSQLHETVSPSGSGSYTDDCEEDEEENSVTEEDATEDGEDEDETFDYEDDEEFVTDEEESQTTDVSESYTTGTETSCEEPEPAQTVPHVAAPIKDSDSAHVVTPPVPAMNVATAFQFLSSRLPTPRLRRPAELPERVIDIIGDETVGSGPENESMEEAPDDEIDEPAVEPAEDRTVEYKADDEDAAEPTPTDEPDIDMSTQYSVSVAALSEIDTRTLASPDILDDVDVNVQTQQQRAPESVEVTLRGTNTDALSFGQHGNGSGEKAREVLVANTSDKVDSDSAVIEEVIGAEFRDLQEEEPHTSYKVLVETFSPPLFDDLTESIVFRNPGDENSIVDDEKSIVDDVHTNEEVAAINSNSTAEVAYENNDQLPSHELHDSQFEPIVKILEEIHQEIDMVFNPVTGAPTSSEQYDDDEVRDELENDGSASSAALREHPEELSAFVDYIATDKYVALQEAKTASEQNPVRYQLHVMSDDSEMVNEEQKLAIMMKQPSPHMQVLSSDSDGDLPKTRGRYRRFVKASKETISTTDLMDLIEKHKGGNITASDLKKLLRASRKPHFSPVIAAAVSSTHLAEPPMPVLIPPSAAAASVTSMPLGKKMSTQSVTCSATTEPTRNILAVTRFEPEPPTMVTSSTFFCNMFDLLSFAREAAEPVAIKAAIVEEEEEPIVAEPEQAEIIDRSKPSILDNMVDRIDIALRYKKRIKAHKKAIAAAVANGENTTGTTGYSFSFSHADEVDFGTRSYEGETTDTDKYFEEQNYSPGWWRNLS